ncbi:snare domain containing protein [Grosmannia clavigera kw1407]|uniref:Snare domain containing protein n=1 Tax=Grosmannia clavigera (strain kw1407 / UAMH 11150) TaxID=655863 RepID=F0X7F5_GROCL|nr:snare domain containing protein [Grosmannia clavigera kw1407]EFX06312.1 snare domain containing protein [Grosmannia clavigera kw1407]
MSFDQLSSVEAGRHRGGGAGGAYSDDPSFQRLTQDLNNKLFKLQGFIANLGRDIGHLGTRQDNARVRERVNDMMDQKLSREFQSALSDFQGLQRQALEKEKASVSAARLAAEEGGAATTGEDGQLLPGGQQTQLQLQQQQEQELARLASQDEVDFQEALIIEREEEIRNIEQGVGDLNVLFTQVATMVHEQGEQIDNIADNVENVRVDTRGADQELRSAARYQRNARSKACCLMLVLAIILTVVVLAISLG